jgi:hypothetical protein
VLLSARGDARSTARPPPSHTPQLCLINFVWVFLFWFIIYYALMENNIVGVMQHTMGWNLFNGIIAHYLENGNILFLSEICCFVCVLFYRLLY